jgi:hypothetical protein
MRACPACGGHLAEAFRFCPWCAAPARRKLVEFFPGRGAERGRALRVSRDFEDEPHVRFSVWDESGTALAAVSIDEHEAERLRGFLRPGRAPTRKRSLLETLLR